MRRKLVLIFVFFTIISSFAGDKLLTMQEAILGSYGKLRVRNINQLKWIGNSSELSCVDSLNGLYGLVRIDPLSGDKKMLLTLDSLKSAVKKVSEISIRRFPSVNWINRDTFYLFYQNNLIVYDLKTQSACLKNSVPDKAQNIRIHPKSFNIAYTIDDNLFVSLCSGGKIQITFDGGNGIKNGSVVHRNEFGINKGIFWSPDGKYLAFYRKDESLVTQYPLVDIDARPAKVRFIRYPMTGMASEHVSVGVYNILSGSTTFLQTGEPADKYLTHVTWSPDSKSVFIAELNRDQNHLRFCVFDPVTGERRKILFEERDKEWVEPLYDPIFIKGKNNRFLWFSMRDGFNNLYLYDTNGRLIRQVTHLKTDITDFSGFDPESKKIFFTAAKNDGLEQHCFSASLKSGKITQLTKQNGLHRIDFSGDGKYFIDRFTNHTVPRLISVFDCSGKKQTELLKAENPVEEYKLGKIEYLKIKNKQGITLNARMILPADFDPQKKYPVIVYVYGGPHGQMVRDSWLSGWSLWFQYMAERGYIVFTLDNRGTNNRGSDFEQAVFRNLGKYEVEDQMAGINYLKRSSFVDTLRIGVHGWSYGGFMTISLMTRQPGVFKTAVAGGPVIDWRYYEVMYGERYMDTPQSNPEGYKEANLLNYVDNLKGKLLIINGAVDPTVVWQNSLSYLRKAIDLGKQVDYFVYPGDEHNMFGKDRVHLYQKITDYFTENL